MYSVCNLSAKVGQKYLLQDINAHFQSGMVHTIIGPNGAGKSTMLKAFAGLSSNYYGKILYHQKDIKGINSLALAQKRAFLNQHPNTAFSYIVKDIVAMGRFPYFYSKPSKTDWNMVEEAMQLTGILHLQNRNSSTLSGGELQRVHFARVIAQCLNPTRELSDKLLFLDEPSNNLDPKYQYELLQLVKVLSKDFGLTVIMVLHDLNLTAQFADKVALMQNAQLIAHDNTDKVLDAQLLESVYEIPFTINNTENGMMVNAGVRNEWILKNIDDSL